MKLPARLANRTGSRSLTGAMTAGLGSGTPPSVSIKGGVFTLVDSGGEKIPIEGKLDCVIFDVNLEVPIQRVFWGLDEHSQPRAFSEGAQAPPVCFSDNGIGASAQASEPQSASCQSCAMNRFDWVSKIDPSKKTKACNAIKKLAIYPVYGDLDAEGVYQASEWLKFPFLLRVPIMSHDNLRVYGQKFAGQKFDVSDVVTRIGFVHGRVGVLDFEAVGFTDDVTEALIQSFIAEHKGDALIGRGDVPWNGQRAAEIEAPRTVGKAPELAASYGQGSQGTAVQQTDPHKQTAQQADPTKPKRGRPPATPKPAAQSAPAAPPQSNGGNGIPPFLRRPSAPVAQTQGAQQPGPFAPPTPPAPAASSHGIVSNVPAPSGEMEKALKSVFGLKT